MSADPRGFDPATDPAALAGCPAPLSTVFDVALLDLDGVLYIGGEQVPHAAASLEVADRAGMRREYVTNNALRTPDDVAAILNRLGIPATVQQVVTSAQAVATLIAQQIPPGSRVLVAGGPGLETAVRDMGLLTVRGADDAPAAVVLGYDPSLDYGRLAEAALAVRRGATFFAANRDATVPTPRGPLPGMGAICSFVVTATGVEPMVAGKPELALHAESLRRSGAKNPLVVGDRLDTDIEGAKRAGTPSLLVLTGVTEVRDLLDAPPERRPDFVATDLRGLNVVHHSASDGHCGNARAEYDSTSRVLRVTSRGDNPGDAIRAVVTAGWTARDKGYKTAGIEGLDRLD